MNSKKKGRQNTASLLYDYFITAFQQNKYKVIYYYFSPGRGTLRTSFKSLPALKWVLRLAGT